jgi:hypothetical protein
MNLWQWQLFREADQFHHSCMLKLKSWCYWKVEIHNAASVFFLIETLYSFAGGQFFPLKSNYSAVDS